LDYLLVPFVLRIQIEAKSRELEEAQQVIISKDREIQQILAQSEQFDVLRRQQEDTEGELKAARYVTNVFNLAIIAICLLQGYYSSS